jgi:hypothetical protein
MSELSSGGSNEGEPVPMMVSQNVTDPAGQILIAKGTPIQGHITWARSEGTLGSALGQPARLNFKFTDASTVDGSRVELSADRDSDKDYELNRENTGIVDSPTLDEVSKDQSSKQALDALRDMFQSGDADKIDDPAVKERLSEIAKQLGMSGTEKIARKQELGDVSKLIEQVRHGSAIATGGSTALVDAALELAGLVGKVGSRLGKVIGGRNIKAYVGTEIIAYVRKPVQVTSRLEP